MNNILYILIFSTLLFSCSDSGKLSSAETVEKSEAKLDTEKLAAVKIGEFTRGKYGYINAAGEVAIEPQFDKAYSFSNGLALAKRNDKKKGYINTEGEFAIEPQVDSPFYISTLSNGLAVIKIDDKCGYINEKGEVVVEPRFDDARSFTKTK